MQPRFRRIQHLLTALRVLEAAARRESFTLAGDELGLSQPTVSRHIANLEEDLRVDLFTRNHNKLKLTEAGRALADSVNLGLTHIDSAVRDISSHRPTDCITLACTHSFAHGWLLPRFSSLRRAIPGVTINLVVSYWLQDVNLDETELIVSWRTQGWTDWPRLSLFDEITYPVCSPDYLQNHPHLEYPVTPPDLLQKSNLLNYDERDSEYAGWQNWFASQGLDYEQAQDAYLFSNYHFMIQAAMDGEGIALGWHHLVSDQIDAGRLKRIGAAHKHTDSRYTLEYREDRIQSDHLSAILNWFREEARKIPDV